MSDRNRGRLTGCNGEPPSGNWVISTFMPRMAARNALDAQPATFGEAITLNGLIRIVRAGRRETTTWWSDPRKGVLIKTYHEKCDLLHLLRTSALQDATAREKALDGNFDLRKRCLRDRLSSYKETIPAITNNGKLPPYRFADPALRAIAHHCIADPSAGGNRKTRRSLRFLVCKKEKE